MFSSNSSMSFWDTLLRADIYRRVDRQELSRLHFADKILKKTQKVSMVLLVAVLVLVTSSGLSSNEILGNCPSRCQCYNLQMDCSHRGFSSVPKGIPRNVEKMWVISSYFSLLLLFTLYCIILRIHYYCWRKRKRFTKDDIVTIIVT